MPETNEASLHVLRRFRAGEDVSPDDVLAALTDPDPAIDRELDEGCDRWAEFEAFWRLVPSPAARQVPPGRWLRILWIGGNVFLDPDGYGPVPPDVRAELAERLWLDVRELRSEAVAGWLGRTDVFEPAVAVAFAREALEHGCDGPVPILEALGALGTRAALDLQLDTLRELGDAAEPVIAALDLDRDALIAMVTRDDVLDDFEHDTRTGVTTRLVNRLASLPGAKAIEACLAVLARAPEGGGPWGFDVVMRLAAANGRAVKRPFKEALAEPWWKPRDLPAGIAMREVVEARPVWRKLVGTVPHRPRGLNPIGIEEHKGYSIPVLADGVQVGVARSARYPRVETTEVEFLAEINPSKWPAAWLGGVIAFDHVDQSKGWPGPACLAIHLAARRGPESGGES